MPGISNINIDSSLLEGLSEQERTVLLSTLKDISKGDMKSFDDLKYADYDEIPVDIETFLTDKRYLGNGLTDNGKFTVFPYWVRMLKKLFPTNLTTAYNTLILTGGIGLGKSLAAVLAMLYLLYRLLCLKDPYSFYGMQPIDKITVSLINVTEFAAKGVAWDKIQQLVQMSPWFMEHGILSGRTNLKWEPNKRIELVIGSNNNTIIGRALFCLDGDTVIKTEKGDRKLQDLVGQSVRVFSLSNQGDVILSDRCTVMPTVQTTEEYQVELEDGSTLKCTGDHRFLLKGGAYKCARDLTVTDELTDVAEPYSHEVVTSKGMRIKDVRRVLLDSLKQYYDVVEAHPYNNFLVKSRVGYVVSHNCNFTDEINFAAMTTDVEKIKAKQKRLISQVDARMQSRFMKGTYLPTLNIIASSKTNDQSFLDSYIETKRKNNSTTTLIVDEAQWVIRNDKGTPDDPGAFYVAVGNKFLASEVLPQDATEALVDSYRAKGYQMMKVPPGYYEAFVDNVELALTDIAGISTTSALKYISGVRLNEVKIQGYSNPFSRDIIEVGTGDEQQYSQYFDLDKVPLNLKAKPLYIHLDMSKSGDKTGIAGTWIMGKRYGIGNNAQSKEAYYRLAFSVSVKAPKGYEISFEKNRTFIRWLRANGFNIKCVTMDTYQSAQIKQQLEADKFNTKILSVDRLENVPGTNTKVCLPYAFFKSAIYERRFEIYSKCDLLTDEIVGLEREPDGHIEHPLGGTQGSKDQADAACGSLYTASQDIEKYAFDYGEEMEDALKVNGELVPGAQMQQQIQVAFEEELQDLLTPSSIKKQVQEEQKKQSEYSTDAMTPLYASQGILIW